jgi:hypothetical protein
MRWLEVRRHSLTKKGAARGRGSHLSGSGVRLARGVGAELGAVAYVLTSASPRAIEPTLVACLPEAGHGSWGAPLGHCDGARLGFDGERFVSIQFRRAPAPAAG